MASLNASSKFTLFIDSVAVTRTYEQLVSLHVANSVAAILPPVSQSGELQQEGTELKNEIITATTEQYLKLFPESSQIPISESKIAHEIMTCLQSYKQATESRLAAKGPRKIEELLGEVVQLIQGKNPSESEIVRAIDIVKNWPGAYGTKILFYTTVGEELRSSQKSTDVSILENIQKRFPNIAF